MIFVFFTVFFLANRLDRQIRAGVINVDFFFFEAGQFSLNQIRLLTLTDIGPEGEGGAFERCEEIIIEHFI
ncbi:hypothetical protein D3C81_1976010 [compost metagenome]